MKSIWFGPIGLETINREMRTGLIEALGIEFTDIGSEHLAAQMPVGEKTLQFMGILHGGASCALAETAGSVAAHYCVDPALYSCVGLDINVNHVKAVRSGMIEAIARPLHIGKTTQVWDIRIADAAHRLIAISRLTVSVLCRR